MTGAVFIHSFQTIGTSEEAINMGDVSAPGWCYFKNHDATNFISLRAATSGANFVQLNPGEVACFRMSATATAPFAISDTGACVLEYLIIQT